MRFGKKMKPNEIKELLYAYIGRRIQMKRKEKYITQHDLAEGKLP